eukprot:scaffold11070_cov318-Chaetoceros_neogracile.AAC.2
MDGSMSDGSWVDGTTTRNFSSIINPALSAASIKEPDAKVVLIFNKAIRKLLRSRCNGPKEDLLTFTGYMSSTSIFFAQLYYGPIGAQLVLGKFHFTELVSIVSWMFFHRRTS